MRLLIQSCCSLLLFALASLSFALGCSGEGTPEEPSQLPAGTGNPSAPAPSWLPTPGGATNAPGGSAPPAVSAAPYEDSSTTYPMLAALTEPAVGAEGQYPDTRLVLTFDAPPTLGPAGSVRIFSAEDDSLVDTIAVSGETDAIGPSTGTSGGRVRVVNTLPITITGNSVSIAPHQGVLQYGSRYYIGIAAQTFNGTLGGTPFTGLGKAAGWTFATRAEAPQGANISVDDDGELADFRTVQGALNHIMATQEVDTPATINVSNGVYEELLFLRGKKNLTIRGESRDGVVIRYSNSEGLNGGTGSSSEAATSTTGGRSLFLVETADLLTLEALTLHSTHLRTGQGDQAEALYFDSGLGRLIAKNAAFLAEQDTLQLKGFAWFYESLIAGNTDFIWGGNSVSLFEQSEIRMLGDARKSEPTGGYIVQARSVTAAAKGFVFLNSSLTHAPHFKGTPVATGTAAKTFLARSGGKPTYFDSVAYINCKMDTHIAAAGWADPSSSSQPAPNPATASSISGWKEYGSTDLAGTPLDLAGRSASAHPLTAEEYAAEYSTREQIFSAIGWVPVP